MNDAYLGRLKQIAGAGMRRLPVKRSSLDGALDWLRWQLDRFPHLDYQPLPWLGVSDAARCEGVYSRWEVVRPIVEELGCVTSVDVGANVGFFSISMAKMGVTTLAIEGEGKYARTIHYASQRLGLTNIGIGRWWINPATVGLVPSADCIVFLAVWHHLVRSFGLDEATAIVRSLWSRSQKVLFFESGELEMPPDFNLPFQGTDPRIFIEKYLVKNCDGSRVEHLGVHQAFAPSGATCRRNLFAVFRS